MVEETARQMTWHKTGKRTELDVDGKRMMVHTSDGEAWKRFNALREGKVVDPRHPRDAISTDGFIIFVLMAAQYSCWPVFVIPLNLPPDRLCKERTFS